MYGVQIGGDVEISGMAFLEYLVFIPILMLNHAPYLPSELKSRY